MSKQFNTRVPKTESKILLASSIQESSEKKQDPLKIVLSCRVAYYKDIKKNSFKISWNMIERCTNKKKMKNKKYRSRQIFSSDIIKIFYSIVKHDKVNY